MSLISIKYVGKRPEYTDGTYGTGIHFVQGESRMVPADKARLFLRHPDVYVPGEENTDVAFVPVASTEDDDVQDVRDTLAIMDKDALSVYAKTHFQIKIDKRKDVGILRSEVTGMVDRFGAL